ncbi:MAG: hypothetical protein QMC81_01295 [Thermoanaerobacterales bacterium]|nr:hypothetical protein [Thermoanaerobacterales bacterium]
MTKYRHITLSPGPLPGLEDRRPKRTARGLFGDVVLEMDWLLC